MLKQMIIELKNWTLKRSREILFQINSLNLNTDSLHKWLPRKFLLQIIKNTTVRTKAVTENIQNVTLNIALKV